MIQRNTYDYQVNRALERKLYLVNLRGGECEECGYKKNLSAFEFHHRNPEEKEKKLDSRVLSNSTMEDILEEFEKCKVLCSNCHREHHYPQNDMLVVIERIKTFNSTIIETKKVLPKCCDCGKEINYTYTRCRDCEFHSRRKVGRPGIDSLKIEVEQFGQKWCAEKYDVARQTIGKWLKNAPLS